jgi:hypothetical protein
VLTDASFGAVCPTLRTILSRVGQAVPTTERERRAAVPEQADTALDAPVPPDQVATALREPRQRAPPAAGTPGGANGMGVGTPAALAVVALIRARTACGTVWSGVRGLRELGLPAQRANTLELEADALATATHAHGVARDSRGRDACHVERR